MLMSSTLLEYVMVVTSVGITGYSDIAVRQALTDPCCMGLPITFVLYLELHLSSGSSHGLVYPAGF